MARIFLCALLMVSFLSSCRNKKYPENSNAISDTITQSEPMSQMMCSLQDMSKEGCRSRKVFIDILMSIPGPIELTLFAKEQQVNYQPNLLNIAVADLSVQAKKRYEQAWLLGAYFTGLTQAWVYQKPKVAQTYLKVIQQLTMKLGLTQDFNYSALNFLSTNPHSSDGFLVKITQAYHNILQSFFDFGDAEFSTSAIFMSLGSFTESLHFLASDSHTSDNKILWERLGEQKQMLEAYLILLYFYEDMPKVKPILTALDKLQALLEQVKVEYQAHDSQITIEDDIIVLIEQSTVKMTMNNYLKNKLPTLIKQLQAQQLLNR